MSVVRVEKNKNYTTMCNEHLKDSKLSLKAKGLLSIMLSLPSEWHYSVKGLKRICKESINTINSVLQELEDNDYLIRKRVYLNGKISEWEYLIFENKKSKNLYLKNEDIENEDIENEDIENEDVYKYTKQSNTKELNTNIINNKSIRHKYGEYGHVLLTDEQLEKLKSQFPDYEEKIRNLDEYIQMKGAKYKDHYLTILNWSRREKKQTNRKQDKPLPAWYFNQEQGISNDEVSSDEVKELLKGI